jgi:hypothetical protein
MPSGCARIPTSSISITIFRPRLSENSVRVRRLAGDTIADDFAPTAAVKNRSRIHPELLNLAQVMKAETMLRWHRAGFKPFWRWKSRRRRGHAAAMRRN